MMGASQNEGLSYLGTIGHLKQWVSKIEGSYISKRLSQFCHIQTRWEDLSLLNEDLIS